MPTPSPKRVTRVQIFLLGEAVSLMKDELIAALTPVGWPPLSEIMRRRSRTKSRSCVNRVLTGPCGPRRTAFTARMPAFVTPPDLVALVQWADKVLSE